MYLQLSRSLHNNRANFLRSVEFSTDESFLEYFLCWVGWSYFSFLCCFLCRGVSKDSLPIDSGIFRDVFYLPLWPTAKSRSCIILVPYRNSPRRTQRRAVYRAMNRINATWVSVRTEQNLTLIILNKITPSKCQNKSIRSPKNIPQIHAVSCDVQKTPRN